MKNLEIFEEAKRLSSVLTEKDIKKELVFLDCFFAVNGVSGLFDEFKTMPGSEIQIRYVPSNVLIFIVGLLYKLHQNELKCLTLFIKIIDTRLILNDINMDKVFFNNVAISIFHEQYMILSKIDF